MKSASTNDEDNVGIEQDMATMGGDSEAPPVNVNGSTGGDGDGPPSTKSRTNTFPWPKQASKLNPVEVPIWSDEKGTNGSAIGGGGGADEHKPSITNNVDLDRMKDSVFFLYPDRNQRLSRFWILLILAAVIATSGVISDSAATVIGAMIVAPLMTPILGVMLSSVLTDGRNFFCSIFLVLAGMGSCILIGFVFGLIVSDDVISKDNNSQVAGRVSPKIPDLIGALATGMVGAIALVRTDIADALPGVAISISLVPPLTVVGLMLSSKENADAAGAMLLFATNFMSIQVMGIFTMYLFGVQKMASRPRARYTPTVFLVMAVCLAFIAVPLYYSSTRLSAELSAQSCLTNAINNWAEPLGWQTDVVVIRSNNNELEGSVVISGPPPFPSEDELDSSYIAQLCPTVQVVSVSFLPTKTIDIQPTS